MFTNNLGYPRIGNHRELKKACEAYWAGQSNLAALQHTARAIRRNNWQLQQQAGIDLVPCNDFSLYDHVLDMCVVVSAIPQRFHALLEETQLPETDLYFAMARGYQQNGYDIAAMEMTRWFDTNYHYIVPEFTKGQQFNLLSDKIVKECREAIQAGIQPKPVILGPVSFLLLGKEKEKGFHRISLLKNLLPVYLKLLTKLDDLNIRYIQFDEPCLSLNLSDTEKAAVVTAYFALNKQVPHISLLLTSYFECYGDNLATVLSLPVHILHLDLTRCPSQLEDVLATGFAKGNKKLSLGVIDGRNIWKNDFSQSLKFIRRAVAALGENRVMIAPSCSLLHLPCDLDNEPALPAHSRSWLSFAKQKLQELVQLKMIALNDTGAEALLKANQQAIAAFPYHYHRLLPANSGYPQASGRP